MRRLLLIIQLIGISALLAGSILGTFIVVEVGLFASLTWLFASKTGITLIIFISFIGLIALYWHFIVIKVFNHVRKSLRKQPN